MAWHTLFGIRLTMTLDVLVQRPTGTRWLDSPLRKY